MFACFVCFRGSVCLFLGFVRFCRGLFACLCVGVFWVFVFVELLWGLVVCTIFVCNALLLLVSYLRWRNLSNQIIGFIFSCASYFCFYFCPTLAVSSTRNAANLYISCRFLTTKRSYTALKKKMFAILMFSWALLYLPSLSAFVVNVIYYFCVTSNDYIIISRIAGKYRRATLYRYISFWLRLLYKRHERCVSNGVEPTRAEFPGIWHLFTGLYNWMYCNVGWFFLLFLFLQAIKLGFNDTRCVMEPAGALAIAGMRKYLKEKGLVGHSVRF